METKAQVERDEEKIELIYMLRLEVEELQDKVDGTRDMLYDFEIDLAEAQRRLEELG